MRLQQVLFVTFAPFAVVLGAPAGQAADESTPSFGASSTSKIENIVVNATRQEANLQDVPVAITALSGQSLTELSVWRPWELGNQVPGLTVTADSGRGTQPSFAIRGVGPEFGAAAGSVETYFADVPLSGPFQEPAMSAQFFDLQSIQVLKGPQGTLFGRTTTAGAILVVPQAPTGEFGGYGRVQVGDYGDFQAEGAVNVPIVDDKVLLRIAGFDWTRSGYGRTTTGRVDFAGRPLPLQTYDNQNVLELRGTLAIKLEDLENSTIVTYHRDDNRNTSHASVTDPSTVLGALIDNLYPGITSLPVHKSDISTDLSKFPSENWGIFNTTAYALAPALSLKNIFGYIHAQGVGNVSSDVDGTPLPAIDLPPVARIDTHNQFTDELQLRGKSLDDRLTWIVGGIVDETRQPGGANKGPLINVTNALPGVNTYFQQNTANNFGVYGSVSYGFTNDLTGTAAFRHTWNDNHVVQDDTSLTNAQFLANPGMVIADYPASVLTHLDHNRHFEGDMYDAGLQYQFSPLAMVYGGYRHGFKLGGFNVSSPPNAPSEQEFAPESVDDFHLGLKSEFEADGIEARFNIEGFWDLYYNKQVSYLTLTALGNSAALSTVTINVPKTTYRGFDIDTTLVPADWLDLHILYTYIDAEYDDWPDPTFGATAGAPGCPVAGCADLHLDLSHNPVAFVSPNKISMTARFHVELSLGEFVFQPNLSYQDKLYTIGDAHLLPQGETAWLGVPYNYDSAARAGDFINAYMLINLRAELDHILGGSIDAAININNVTNKVYSLGNTTSIAYGVQSDSYGPPRMITLELSTRL
jgi:iron complex outermembrane receptor protein